MVEAHKTPINWLLIGSITISALLFLTSVYYFLQDADNQKNQSISHANQACLDQINAKKAALINACEKERTIDDKKLCHLHNESKLNELEVICPRATGEMRARYRKSENQLLPFFKAGLLIAALWLIGLGGGRKAYQMFSKKPDQ